MEENDVGMHYMDTSFSYGENSSPTQSKLHGVYRAYPVPLTALILNCIPKFHYSHDRSVHETDFW